MGFDGSEPIPDYEYEYTAVVRAKEAFTNVLYGLGIGLALQGNERTVTFTHQGLIDMQELKDRGIVGSYRIAKVRRLKQIISTG